MSETLIFHVLEAARVPRVMVTVPAEVPLLPVSKYTAEKVC